MVVSGGDAPGVNAALLHYALLAESQGDTVCGAQGGFPGTLAGRIIPLTSAQLAPWAGMPGSIIESSREAVLSQPDAREKLVAVIAEYGIDGIVLFGGNGSLRYLLPLLKTWGIPVIGLPTTIDNDVPGTERSLGFDSACNYAYQAIDGISATAHALSGRIFLVETLGGTSGMLALDIAFGAQAHAALLPEYAYQDDWLAGRLKWAVERFGYALCVVCEGARGSRTLADQIPTWTQIRVRDTRLGHAQRGGTPTHADRWLGGSMARLAYWSLREGTAVGVVTVKAGRVALHPGTLEGIEAPMPDRAIYNIINGFSE
jgi:6-phosphofructokinase 1